MSVPDQLVAMGKRDTVSLSSLILILAPIKVGKLHPMTGKISHDVR